MEAAEYSFLPRYSFADATSASGRSSLHAPSKATTAASAAALIKTLFNMLLFMLNPVFVLAASARNLSAQAESIKKFVKRRSTDPEHFGGPAQVAVSPPQHAYDCLFFRHIAYLAQI